MEENNPHREQEIINIKEVYNTLKVYKKLYAKVLAIVFVLSAAWILPEPRTYTSELTLAPEMSSMSGGGALADLASSFGFDLGSMQSADAIYPTLYPDIMESTPFVVSLFDIRVKSLDGEIDTDYYHYLDKLQKTSFWKVPFNEAKKFINNLTAEPEMAPGAKKGGKSADPTFLSRRQTDIATHITDNVKCLVDKKTEVITITVTDQDRLICAALCDSVRVRLQKYITDYRTKKSRNDIAHYKQLAEDAKQRYTRIRQQYTSFSDANVDASLKSVLAKQEDLENEMQLLYNQYTVFNTQLQAAEAKLQDRTPAFSVIQCASVPIKPTGPKRMIFVAGMMILSFIGTSLYLLKFKKA